MTQRVYNFSPGPAVLPLPVLEEAQRDLVSLPGVGMSVLEVSHRSKCFEGMLAEAKSLLTELLGIPAGYSILFLQGGASLQFSMLPMNLLRGAGKPADYIITGTWGSKALAEAKREGSVRVAWDGKSGNYSSLPARETRAKKWSASLLRWPRIAPASRSYIPISRGCCLNSATAALAAA